MFASFHFAGSFLTPRCLFISLTLSGARIPSGVDDRFRGWGLWLVVGGQGLVVCGWWPEDRGVWLVVCGRKTGVCFVCFPGTQNSPELLSETRGAEKTILRFRVTRPCVLLLYQLSRFRWKTLAVFAILSLLFRNIGFMIVGVTSVYMGTSKRSSARAFRSGLICTRNDNRFWLRRFCSPPFITLWPILSRGAAIHSAARRLPVPASLSMPGRVCCSL